MDDHVRAITDLYCSFNMVTDKESCTLVNRNEIGLPENNAHLISSPISLHFIPCHVAHIRVLTNTRYHVTVEMRGRKMNKICRTGRCLCWTGNAGCTHFFTAFQGRGWLRFAVSGLQFPKCYQKHPARDKAQLHANAFKIQSKTFTGQNFLALPPTTSISCKL